MTIEVTPVETGTEDQNQPTVIESKSKDVDATTSELNSVKAELEKNKELLAKVRKFERENKEAAEFALKEQGKYKELFESEQEKRTSLEAALKERALTSELTKHLTEVGVKSLQTALKIVDKTRIGFTDTLDVDVNTVKAVVADLVKSDPVLFDSKGGDQHVTTKQDQSSVGEQKIVPELKRASETTNVGGYEKEIASAKTHKQLVDVMKKYGKIN